MEGRRQLTLPEVHTSDAAAMAVAHSGSSSSSTQRGWRGLEGRRQLTWLAVHIGPRGGAHCCSELFGVTGSVGDMSSWTGGAATFANTSTVNDEPLTQNNATHCHHHTATPRSCYKYVTLIYL
jgi:hypothetical protein